MLNLDYCESRLETRKTRQLPGMVGTAKLTLRVLAKYGTFRW